MNKNFIVQDRNNNIQKKADTIIKFNVDNKDYLIYSIEENEENRQIFISKLILNSEGKYFIDNILPEEKGKLSNIVYNIVILTPTEAKKGNDGSLLINSLSNKFSIKLSIEIPELGEQEYYNNCSIAITSKILVEDAVKFYEESLVSKTIPVQQETTTPMWTLPVENSIPETVATPEPIVGSNEMVQNIAPVTQAIPSTQEVNNISVSQNAGGITNTAVEEVKPNLNEASIPNLGVATANQEINPNISMPVSDNAQLQDQVKENLPNPQVDKLGGNIAIVSDPSLEAAGVAVQPNVGKMKKAGFAINKYIVIGTLCILLAIAVVIVAYILIQKKTTGV